MANQSWSLGDPSYALTRHFAKADFAKAVEAAREALKQEGFGVLTEIDVKETMKKKLDADVDDYLILGACNPPLAHKALSAEPGIGVLLPCNVVVAREGEGVAISAIDPRAMFSVLNTPGVESIADEVRNKLGMVLERIDLG